jgi:hypothetical protein
MNLDEAAVVRRSDISLAVPALAGLRASSALKAATSSRLAIQMKALRRRPLPQL